jgi:hypothetical protein
VSRIAPRRAANGLVGALLLSGAIMVTGPASADAACSTSTGISYYLNTGCSSLLKTINGDTTINDLSTQSPNMNNNISSVSESPANSQGSWRLYLYDSINRSGTYLGLSNASTTSFKSWDLTQLNFNDLASSLCQIRVVGTSSPC